MRVAVVAEYYTVATDVGSGACMRGETREGRYEAIAEAVEAAMRVTLDRKVGCNVLRVTVHEPVAQDWPFGPSAITETVTGSVSIPGPRSYSYDPALSRYHPVNGWDVPATIELED